MVHQRIYLDCAASTPVDQQVQHAMEPYVSRVFGNPGSVHEFGREAQAALDTARQGAAQALGIEFNNVVFAASATEANNLAIQGVIKRYRGLRLEHTGPPHIITTAIEHESVLAVCNDLEHHGLAEVTYVPVDAHGFVSAAAIASALRRETILVSVMYVNNVTGAIQPIREIGERIREFRKQKLLPQHHSQYTPQELLYPVFHTDAAQAVHSMESIALPALCVDAMTVSSHKLYGPKGAGALLADFPIGLGIAPIMLGGMQEFGMRPSTQDVPSIVGLGTALGLARQNLRNAENHVAALKEILMQGIHKAYPRAQVHSYEPCIPGVCNVSFPGFGLEELLYRFDRHGIAVAAGSACSAKALKPSHALLAMGLDDSLASSAVRFSFGRHTTKDEMKRCAALLPSVFASRP